ncbi:uncharacterized protein LOC128390325 [Panonychus citri]|uniref:uncharacterized protein LOC128390325 n=1 Tax=Panonychus citri TaxID=50023 RepID=UPI002307E5FE|nr:uncharacterized protein LOC128390325 [Panonychus citri]
MVKLDANMLKYLESDDFRVITAVEMGMKNHQLVPGSLISSIAGLRGGGTSKILNNLTKNKLLVYERGKKYDGYRLNFHGYDSLALNVLSRRGVVSHLGNQIGVGKESDVYIVGNEEGERFAMKLHRLGRTSFRKVHDKRDYHHHGKVNNWIYMSRLSAAREFSFLKALHERGFPVPKPIDINRHCIVMELINGTLLNHVAELEDKATIYDSLMNLLLSLANDYGVVHGDFNEFNIMIDNENLTPILIDFPQMISTNHKMAREYFQRDVECVVNIFKRKYHFESEDIPNFDRDVIIDEKEEGIIGNLSTEANEFEPVINNDLSDLDDNSVLPGTSESISNEENPLNIAGSKVGTYSVAGSTFTTEMIKTKLQNEFASRSRREELKKASKSIKGEDSRVRRQRRDNDARIRDDKALGNSDWFVNQYK